MFNTWRNVLAISAHLYVLIEMLVWLERTEKLQRPKRKPSQSMNIMSFMGIIVLPL
jgi:hypothetical protein